MKSDHARLGAFFVLLCLTSLWYNYPHVGPLDKFGWEYGWIAESLVKGNGFSDPFGVPSGPTAWMPPLLSFIFALVFKVFGIKTLASGIVLVAIEHLFVVGAIALLLRLARDAGLGTGRLLIFPIVYTYMMLNRGYLFQSLHDVSLVMLLLTLLVYGWWRMRRQEIARADARLFALTALIVPLASPVAALLLLGILASLLAEFWSTPKRAFFAIVLALYLVSSGAWAARNYLRFGKFIFVKSNVWYEVYQSSQGYGDGVLSATALGKAHPAVKTINAIEISALGEQRFLEKYKALALRAIADNPREMLRRLGNRMRNAFVMTHIEDNYTPAQRHFNRRDRVRLGSSELAYSSTDTLQRFTYWLAPAYSPNSVRQLLSAWGVCAAGRAFRDWKRKSAASLRVLNSPYAKATGLLMAGIPMLISLAILLRLFRAPAVLRPAALVHLSYLLPYVIISHYVRYQIPLAGIFALTISWAAVGVFGRLGSSRLAAELRRFEANLQPDEVPSL